MVPINRDLWRMTAVCADPNPEVAWLVLLAIQQPHEVVFLELRRRERTFDPDVAYTRSNGRMPFHFSVFDKHPLRHFTEGNVPLDPNGDIFVFMQLQHQQ